MKLYLPIVLCIPFLALAWGQEHLQNNKTLCKEVILLKSKLPSSTKADKILYNIAQLAQQIDISPKDYNQNSDYKNICHLKVIKSANFGDFVSYDGHHYQQLIKRYPNSSLKDDASYALIYVISSTTYNYEDLEKEKKKLEIFIKKYPKSNFYNKAKKRIISIEQVLKNGGGAILD